MKFNIDSILKKHYKIIETIEETTSSTVLRVEPAEGGREFVLKVMKNDRIEDPEELKYVRRECKALSNLHHRNIVRFFNTGITDDGTPYGVMEYLQGKSLKETIKESGHIQTSRAIPIMQQICEGMAFAHKEGILHRDLTPECIVLVESNGEEQVKITDFKVAKFTNDSVASTQSLTKTGLIVGSPSYISPEQITGMQVDQRSEVYSCGCIFYELLTGQKPFQSRNPAELINQHCTEDAPPFADTNGGKESPPQLEWICRKALQKDPELRYQSLDEMLSDLKLAEEGSEKLSANPAKNQHLQPLIRREKEAAVRTGRSLPMILLLIVLIAIAAVAIPSLIPADVLVKTSNGWSSSNEPLAVPKETIDWLNREEHKNSNKIEAVHLQQSSPTTGLWHQYVSEKGLLRYSPGLHCGVVVLAAESKIIYFNDKTRSYFPESIEKWLSKYRSLLGKCKNEIKKRQNYKGVLPLPNMEYDIESMDLSNDFLTRVPYSQTRLTTIPQEQVREAEGSEVEEQGIQYSNFSKSEPGFETDGDQFLLDMMPKPKSYPIFQQLYGKFFPNGLPVMVLRLNHNGSRSLQYETNKLPKNELTPESIFSYPKDYSQVASEEAVISDAEGRKVERRINSGIDVSDDVQELLNDATPRTHSGAD